MNAENLHDALNQLPDDLIAATDALRHRKKPLILWKRMVPMAACFALVLGALYVMLPTMATKDAAPEAAAPMEMMQDAMSGMQSAGLPETAAPAEGSSREEPGAQAKNDGSPLAPEAEEETEAFGTTMIPVTGHSYFIGSEEPDETVITLICTRKEWDEYLLEMTRLQDAEDFVNSYDDGYFEENQLIAVMTTAASSSVRYEMEAIVKTGTGTWELTITQYLPEWFTDDMEQQLLLVELPRTVEPEDTITLNLEEIAE